MTQYLWGVGLLVKNLCVISHCPHETPHMACTVMHRCPEERRSQGRSLPALVKLWIFTFKALHLHSRSLYLWPWAEEASLSGKVGVTWKTLSRSGRVHSTFPLPSPSPHNARIYAGALCLGFPSHWDNPHTCADPSDLRAACSSMGKSEEGDLPLSSAVAFYFDSCIKRVKP